jgi:hypothetical protein
MTNDKLKVPTHNFQKSVKPTFYFPLGCLNWRVYWDGWVEQAVHNHLRSSVERGQGDELALRGRSLLRILRGTSLQLGAPRWRVCLFRLFRLFSFAKVLREFFRLRWEEDVGAVRSPRGKRGLGQRMSPRSAAEGARRVCFRKQSP